MDIQLFYSTIHQQDRSIFSINTTFLFPMAFVLTFHMFSFESVHIYSTTPGTALILVLPLRLRYWEIPEWAASVETK